MVLDLFRDNTRLLSDRPALRRRVASRWEAISWAGYGTPVREAAAGLVALGIGPGHRVGILSGNRAEWYVADLSTVRQAVDDVRNAAEDASTVSAREGDFALGRLWSELGITEAEVAAEFAEARASLAAVAAGLAKNWQSRIDGLRVQFEFREGGG